MRIFNKKKIERKICSCCGIEKNIERNFYISREKGKERMDVCKDCFIEEFRKNERIEPVLRKYNIPFIATIFYHINSCGDECIQEYMKQINSLSQYKGLEWKDSIMEVYDKQENEKELSKSFEEKVIENLKSEVENLYEKIKKARDNGDFGTYKNLIIAYKEVLGLYKEMINSNKR